MILYCLELNYLLNDIRYDHGYYLERGLKSIESDVALLLSNPVQRLVQFLTGLLQVVSTPALFFSEYNNLY